MSQTLTMYGYSDDLVEVEGLRQWNIRGDLREEFPINRKDRGTFCLGGKLFIRMQYGQHAATWGIEVTPVTDGIEIPWGIMMYIKDYTPVLVISDLEDDVTLIQVHEDEEYF